ncbi:DNA translocase FtsK [Candidatus Babeliales bacterium]|nr:DNA translocase FtsK [Candidatus Babeliales bacterium]
MKEKILAYSSHYFKLYIASVAMLVATVLVSISLYSFHPDDLSFFYHATSGNCQNILGYFGATIAAGIVYLLGSMAYAIPVIMASTLVFMFEFQNFSDQADRFFGLIVSTFLLSAICCFHAVGFYEFSGPGGVIGSLMMKFLVTFDHAMQGIILYSLLMASSILLFRFAHLRVALFIFHMIKKVVHYLIQVDNAPARFVRQLAAVVAVAFGMIYKFVQWMYQVLSGAVVKKTGMSIIQFEQDDENVDQRVDEILQDLFGHEAPVDDLDAKIAQAHQAMQQEQINSSIASHATEIKFEKKEAFVAQKNYKLPDIEKMLDHGNYEQNHHIDKAELAQQSAILEEKLSMFGVTGKVVRVHPGPVITLFEYRPEEHIKLSKIIGLEDDLAMALQALSIRLIAPIPGKDVVGFEVSNKIRTPVLLSNIFHSAAWTKFKGSLPLILGEDTYGNHIVVDLATMPHVLIAGSTGSGKSVALNCMLVSLLCYKKPQDLKLIIIDPKQIEFTAFEKVAHLLFPVITDSKRAVPVLKWLVMTMESRYEQMAELGVKNIFEYQKLQATRSDLEPMPFIVMIIDELADLMMTTGKDAETLIARLAQMARAAGIHMIVATQRPSVDVITGLIKVNFPNRISFKVTSKVDSRTILDEMGAERLLGKGDMLFIDAKDPHIRRVHGAYVSEQEVHYLVSHIQQQQAPEFLDISDFFATESDDDGALFENDQALYQQVVDMLVDLDEVSISLIQRRFRIGYNRSARIMETLQARGLIMPSDGGKMRRVVKD